MVGNGLLQKLLSAEWMDLMLASLSIEQTNSQTAISHTAGNRRIAFST